MAFTSEIDAFLNQVSAGMKIPADEAMAIVKRMCSKIPLDLGLMSSYGDDWKAVDVDVWNKKVAVAAGAIKYVVADEECYLYLSGYPKNRLLKLSASELTGLLTSQDFYFEFAIFTADLSGCLLEDHSGCVVGYGRLAMVVEEVAN